MTDTVVSFLLENLTTLLKSEAKLLSGVEGKVNLLQQELERIKGFLKDSEGKQDEFETVKAVINQIKNVTYEAEDVIDKYIVDVVLHSKRGLLDQFFHGFDHAKMLHNVDKQIESIKDKIKDIYDNKDKYHIIEGESSKAKKEEAVSVAEEVQKRRANVEEDDVVGFDEYAKQVTKLLVEGDTSPLQLVSIVGMVGLGKTTLARKVYKDPLIKKHFSDCCLWEFVTKEFDAKEFLISILRSVNEIPEDELIVLDDMWSSQVLEEIGDAFPNDNMGSRILITTRSDKVASNSKISRTQLYDLKPLSDEDSWILLSKKVFVMDEKYSPTLEAMGRTIARSCKGLPLSIVVIGGILRTKEKSERVWEKMVGNVNWYIKEEDGIVKEIVRLSYETLPSKYKSCFLYFGIYPEDYEINVRQLIQMWIAEGFIPVDDKMSQEDVAEEYMEELIRRNLIQVESRRTDGGVKTCRIHDLLRELIICLKNHVINQVLVPCSASAKTSTILLNIGDGLKSSVYELWNLETLDLRGSKLFELPTGIWKLERLRHLHMSGGSAKLPDIPGKKILSNLQTLSVVCLDRQTGI